VALVLALLSRLALALRLRLRGLRLLTGGRAFDLRLRGRRLRAALRRGSGRLPFGRDGLRGRLRDVAVGLGSDLVGPLLVAVVLDVHDAALRVERRRDLALPVLAAALAATAPAAAPLPSEPPAAAALALRVLAARLAVVTAAS